MPPTLLNVAYQRTFFLDGRQTSFEGQALEPFTVADELANPSLDAVIDRIRELPDYAGRFEEAFGEGPGPRTLAQAITAYEFTLLAADSPFDRWRYGGQEDALDAVAKRGFDLFVGKAGCADCHALDQRDALFTDHLFHDDGIGWDSGPRHRRRTSDDAAPACRSTPSTTMRTALARRLRTWAAWR